MSGHLDGPFDPQKKMEDALRFYANERNWLNHREIRGFPGFHGGQIAANALAACEGVVLVDLAEVTASLRAMAVSSPILAGAKLREAATAIECRFGGNERSE